MKFEDINSVMGKLQEALEASYPGIKIDMGDQGFETPDYPFGSYKILVLNQDATKSASSWIEEIDTVQLKQVVRKNQQASISMSFLHDKSIATCWDLSEKAMDWFDSIQGLSECEKFGITPQLITRDVQDRTTVLESVQYEYKTGFDVMFKSRKLSETQVQATASAPSVEFQEEA
ncbi:hypothetical protein JWG45_21320 [Leptospira sp. 201903070]|uniref:Phage neck terminator protein gp12-like domain-containing protein n=1 Tax=Leptospira ainlahdjerensis TaxID=2810033 RepID=A0ABS2UH69_9LEPT|nr:hypothetical protein [Leptospira ainlahdjerensis]MBM9579693.1 hypothetical protein [Leptospira ainlahdjerensis]